MRFLLLMALSYSGHEASAVTTIDLGTSSKFAVLAGSEITFSGAANSSTISGNIGTFPTTSITGLGNVVLNGVNVQALARGGADCNRTLKAKPLALAHFLPA